MPLAIYAALEGDLGDALALSAILVVVSFAALVGCCGWWSGSAPARTPDGRR